MVSLRILTCCCIFASIPRQSVTGEDDVTYRLYSDKFEERHLSATDRLIRDVQLVPYIHRTKRGTGDADDGAPSGPALPPDGRMPTSLPKNEIVSPMQNTTTSALTKSISTVAPTHFSNLNTQHVPQPVSNETTFSPRTNIPTPLNKTTLPSTFQSTSSQYDEQNSNLTTQLPVRSATQDASSRTISGNSSTTSAQIDSKTPSTSNVESANTTTPSTSSDGTVYNATTSAQTNSTTPSTTSKEIANNTTIALRTTPANLPAMTSAPILSATPRTRPSGGMANFTTEPSSRLESTTIILRNSTSNITTKPVASEAISTTPTSFPLAPTTMVVITDGDHDYYTSSFYSKEEAINLYRDLKYEEEQGLITVLRLSLSDNHLGALRINLPFIFPFYGHDISTIYIATGGFLYLSAFFHQFITATQYIAPLMGNFNPSLSDDATVSYAFNDTTFTVEWEDVPIDHLEQHGGFTFQATLTIDGQIIFAYKKVPLPVSSISGGNGHKVTVGVSDGFYIDTPRFNNPNIVIRSIYIYHTVGLDDRGIADNTAFILRPLLTCNIAHTCEECLLATNTTTFDCDWCPELQRCSSGFDRHRQDWLDADCHEVGVNDTCPTTTTTSTSTTTTRSLTTFEDLNHTTNTSTNVPPVMRSVPATTSSNSSPSSSLPRISPTLPPAVARITTAGLKTSSSPLRRTTTLKKSVPTSTSVVTTSNGKKPITDPSGKRPGKKPNPPDPNSATRRPGDGPDVGFHVTESGATDTGNHQFQLSKTESSIDNTSTKLTLTVIIVLAVIFTIMLLLAITLWVVYSYRNPGSKRAIQVNRVIHGKSKPIDDLEVICETDC